MATIEEQLRSAVDMLKERDAKIAALSTPPFAHATIVALTSDTMVVATGSGYTECSQRPDLKLKVGDEVQINSFGVIVGKSEFTVQGHSGVIAMTHGVFNEIKLDNGPTIFTKYTLIDGLEVGDRVLLDTSTTVIRRKIAKPVSDYVHQVTKVVTWADVGGLEEAKNQLRKTLELPYSHQSLYEAVGYKPSRGFLLTGRPGNGKTLLASAAASALAKVHGKDASRTGFIYIKGPEILSKWVGNAEQAVRDRFKEGAIHKKRFGYPALLFIDEADALLGDRSNRTASGMEHTIVPQFLSEMDGLEESSVIVILATNRADMLDPAVTRPGRIDVPIFVGAPDIKASKEIIKIHMKNIKSQTPIEEIADITVDDLFMEGNYPVYKIRAEKGTYDLCLHHLVSGAIIADIVKKATDVCVDRNIAGSCNPVSLVDLQDFSKAVKQLHTQQRIVNNKQLLQEFVETRGITGDYKVEVVAA